MDKNISGFCPNCHKEVTYSWTYPDENGGNIRNWFREYFKNDLAGWSMGECPSCKNCVLMELNLNQYKLPHSVKKIYPYPTPSPVDIRIPSKIKKDLEEAKLCFSVGAINAAVSMCRRTLQRACKEKGAIKNELKDQIDEIALKGVISSDLKELAHSVRLIGNDGAHPNEEEVTKEDAEEILNLAEQFMDIIFVAPAKVKEIKDRKAKK